MLGHDKRSFWYNHYVILSLFGNYIVVWIAEKSLLQHNSLFPCICNIQVWLWEKGGKSDNQSFYKKEDIALDPFSLQILSISSTSVHFSAKKEVSSKKGNLCTWLYLCMRFSYAQYVAVPCNTNFKLSFCWLLSQLGVIMII